MELQGLCYKCTLLSSPGYLQTGKKVGSGGGRLTKKEALRRRDKMGGEGKQRGGGGARASWKTRTVSGIR